MTASTSADPEISRDARMPATIITGFLGSGKTTLLNHILSNQRGLRTAVIVNEFSDIGIDNELIVAAGADIVELSNGCICCSINIDLADAVRRVLDLAPKVEYLVVETTGLADPLSIVLTFLRGDFRNRVRLNSIITVADASSFSIDLFDGPTTRNQLLYGDVILLNKCDLAGTKDLNAVEERIRAINQVARIVRTTRSEVSLPLILSVGLFQSDRYFSDLAHPNLAHPNLAHPNLAHPNLAHPKDRRRRHDHVSADGFASLSFQSDRAFAVHRFQDFLERLPDTVFRAKGVLWIDESDKRYVFHLVGKRFSLDESGRHGPMTNKLVLIGRNLDQGLLRRQLEACLTERRAG